jgi:hypothetical protein
MSTRTKPNTETFTAPKAVAAIAAKVAKPARRKTSAKAAEDPDAWIEGLVNDHIANIEALNLGPDEGPEADALWAQYEGTRDAIGHAKPVGIRGLQAKARAAKREAWTPKGEKPANTPAADYAWELVNAILRLGPGLDLTGADNELIADHEALDALERQWFALFDTIENDRERDAAAAPIRAAQEPIMDRLARRRATTAAGLAARLRSLLVMEPENDYDANANSSGADADECLESMILRDLSDLLGVPTKGPLAQQEAASKAAGAT